jgi:hypothetical protein
MNSNYLSAMAQWLEAQGVATRGQDLFIGEAPRQISENDVNAPQAWLVAAGGAPEGTDFNLWKRGLFISVFRRDQDPERLFDWFENLANVVAAANKPDVSGSSCFSIDNYDVIRIEISSELIDTDVNSEENKTGVMVLKLTVKQA